MSSAIPSYTPSSFTWEEALHEFFLHLQATRAKKTQQYYKVQVGGLARWAIQEDVPFAGFGKRHMDRFLVSRAEEGKAPLTLHHAAVCAKAFFHWCQKNDIVERSLLADYQVRHAPRPAQYMPTDADMQTLLKSVHDYWNLAKNPSARFYPLPKRVFHRDRNYAILLGLLDSASRIGEMLSLKVDDYRAKERQIVIRETKGREPRTLPVSPEWVEALNVWMRQRSKIMAGQEDEGWLFISEFGGRLDESRFLKALKRITAWAKISEHITLHSLRRYSLNRLAKVNLLATQQIADHKEGKSRFWASPLLLERRVGRRRHTKRDPLRKSVDALLQCGDLAHHCLEGEAWAEEHGTHPTVISTQPREPLWAGD